jgi:hypothetical protein
LNRRKAHRHRAQQKRAVSRSGWNRPPQLAQERVTKILLPSDFFAFCLWLLALSLSGFRVLHALVAADTHRLHFAARPDLTPRTRAKNASVAGFASPHFVQRLSAGAFKTLFRALASFPLGL